MSTQFNWGGGGGATGAGVSNEAAVDNRLVTLRDVALTLLREVEMLRVAEPVKVDHGVHLYDEVKRFETELILSALSRTGGNQTRAARLLGVKLTTLNSKIKRYRISFPGYDAGALPEVAA
jgi:transcriptional regulator with GAF, ATPase, and Fis domain